MGIPAVCGKEKLPKIKNEIIKNKLMASFKEAFEKLS